MDPSVAAAALSLTLFPTSDFREVGVGPYGFETADAPLLVDGLPAGGGAGLELMTRRVFDTEKSLLEDSRTPTGQGMNLRMYRGAAGEIVLDRFELESVPMNIRVRPELGDELDIGLFSGTWNEVWKFGDTGRLNWRIWSPMSVTLLGMSKSDMGTDKLRYYAGVGAGLGGEVLARVAGPIGVQARAQVEGNARRRRDRELTHHTTRQGLELDAELGVTYFTRKTAWVVGAWAEHVTHWEPFDEGGRDGVDRTYWATGARVSGRFYKDREGGLDLPEIADPDLEDIDALLDALRRNDTKAVEELEQDLFEGMELDEVPAEEAQAEPQARPAHLPLEVHWSEVALVDQVKPAWPAGTGDEARCSVRFFVDPTGTPYDVRPEDCAAELLPATMEAVWGWRFEPVVEAGDTVSAQFVYTLGPQDVLLMDPGSSDGN
jgi:hypothetical protein